MQKLILLYWGTVSLMYLSQTYCPVKNQLQGRQSGRHHFMWKKSDIFMIVVVFWLVSTSFLRQRYNDTENYILGFINAASVGEGIESGLFVDWTGNPMSMLYRSLMHDLTDNYHIYFFVPALLSSYAVVKLCKRYSVNPAFSMLIFFSVGTYCLFIAAMKQCFAVFFLLMALPYAIDRKYVHFYLLVLIAVLFHTHAFMFAIVPLLIEKPWGKVTWILLAATLFAMATYDSTLGAFMEYAQSLGAMVAEDEVFDGNSINILRVLVYWVPAIMALVFRQRLFGDSTKTENLFANMSIVSAFILTIGLVEGANLYARMAGYFEIATAITLPWMIKKIFTKQSAQIVTVCAAVLYFGYFWYEFAITKDFSNNYSAISWWQFIQELIAH